MNNPLILALDTATESCSVALWRDGVLAERGVVTAGAGHSQQLLPMAQEVLRDAAVDIKDVDAIAVDNGPGSFTGVRIGVAAAHGLVIGAGGGLALVTVSSLAALAAQTAAPWALPAIDARMGEIYWARYRRVGHADGGVELIGEESVDAPAALSALHGDDREWRGGGSGWDAHHAAINAAAGREIFWCENLYPQAAAVAAIAAFKLKHGGNILSPPSYLRRAAVK